MKHVFETIGAHQIFFCHAGQRTGRTQTNDSTSSRFFGFKRWASTFSIYKERLHDPSKKGDQTHAHYLRFTGLQVLSQSLETYISDLTAIHPARVKFSQSCCDQSQKHHLNLSGFINLNHLRELANTSVGRIHWFLSVDPIKRTMLLNNSESSSMLCSNYTDS